jgi:hypothetical protein
LDAQVRALSMGQEFYTLNQENVKKLLSAKIEEAKKETEQ